MIIGIGTDIVEIDRIEKLSQEKRFLQRVFTPIEQDYCLSKVKSAQHLAARFASKEACIKALGRGVPFLDIEIINEESGRPVLFLHGKALKIGNILGVKDIFLSISHSQDRALAFVLLTGG